MGFRETFSRDRLTHSSAPFEWRTPAPFAVESTQLEGFLKDCGGASFNNGLYRVHSASEVLRWTAVVGEAFPEFGGRLLCFSYDWLGRHFALDCARQEDGRFLILMLEPGTGQALEIPTSFDEFHDIELVEYQNEALALEFYKSWLGSGGRAPGLTECIGYRKPLFLGGTDVLENLELSDMEVYWSLCGQMLNRVRGLGDGTRVRRVDID